jgi:protein-disulfide isomerase
MHAFDRPLGMSATRRTVLAGGSLALAGAALVLSSTAGISAGDHGPAEVSVEELMKQVGDLPDLTLGAADAKVTIVEYASMTCGHCMNFHAKVFPDLKAKYIDTGKIRFVFREFPLDPRAFAASMLARCAGSSDKTFALIDALFHTQADWAFVKENPTPKLFEVAKQAGFTQETFDKCLTDQKLLDQLTAIRTRADDLFGINATPTFFINGKRLQASPTIEEFDKVLGPLLAQG